MSDPSRVAPPLGLLAELTHRCPQGCAYCSNPVALTSARHELPTDAWQSVWNEAAHLGVLQVHLSGGEPALRRDLVALVAHAASRGLYANLVTSGLGLDEDRVGALAAAGLEHLQLSVQGADPDRSDAWARRPGAHAHKQRVARATVGAGLPLTVNWVAHRHNARELPRVITWARSVGARRLEVAHVQYAGWARLNHAALLPTRSQHRELDAQVTAARETHRGSLVIDYVPSDQYARRPKACMGGWGQRFVVVAPDGAVLPCHDARSLPGLRFERVGDRPLAHIWMGSEAFARFRGTGWMPDPCRSCEHRERDFGGCRCQAMAVTGDPARTDPACDRSPDRVRFEALRDDASRTGRRPGPRARKPGTLRPRRTLPLARPDRPSPAEADPW